MVSPPTCTQHNLLQRTWERRTGKDYPTVAWPPCIWWWHCDMLQPLGRSNSCHGYWCNDTTFQAPSKMLRCLEIHNRPSLRWWQVGSRDQEFWWLPQTKIWRGNTNHSLEQLMEQHSLAYMTLQQCAEYVTYQLLHDCTRVKYLIDDIQCTNPGVVTALSPIRLDDRVNGMRKFFDAAVTFLLPMDPIQIK